MKSHLLLILLCIIPSLLCINGGVVAAVNEKMAEAVFKYFYNDINKVVRNFNLDTFKVDGITVRYGNVKIPNFTRNKVKFKFTSNGINIKVNGLSGEATGRGYKKSSIMDRSKKCGYYYL